MKPEPMDRCYICDGFCGTTGERDHFPVPKSLGGADTLPICRPCHDLKDRIPVGEWRPAEALAMFSGLWVKASPAERLALVKMFHVCSQMSAAIAKKKAARKRDRVAAAGVL